MRIEIQRSRDFPKQFCIAEVDRDVSKVLLVDGVASFARARQQALREANRRGLPVINTVTDPIQHVGFSEE